MGQKFGRLEVIKQLSANRSGNITWLCKCDCGNTKIAPSDHLTRKTFPIKSCGCYRKQRKGPLHNQWQGIGEISGGWWANHVTRERNQNTRKKVPVTITKEYAWELYLQQNKKCALSGVDIYISNSSNNNASIDRIDSSKGYEPGNIQWVHKHVNFMKRTYSQDYFIEMCKKIAEKNK